MPGLRADSPGEALRFRQLRMRDEYGFIDPNGLLAAKAQAQFLAVQSTLAPTAAALTPQQWTWIGPSNVGGRIRTIVPVTATKWFAGSVGGGIWTTSDAGASWTPVNDFLANLAVSTIVMPAGQSQVLYAGTGEGFYNGDGIRGLGIFNSVDAGVTWHQLSATNNANFYYVNRLAVSPDRATLLAATRSGLFRSADGGASFGPVTGATDSLGIADVVFHPTDSTRAVASGFLGEAWYSTDGGGTWTPASGLPGGSPFRRVEVAYVPTNPNVVYAAVDINGGTLYASGDGGATYVVVNGPPNWLGGQGWYDNVIWIDPTNPNTMVLGGTSLYRTTNGGTTWTGIGGYFCCNVHPDEHAIVALPGYDGTTNTAVLVGNDGGVFFTTDILTAGTTGWVSENNNLGVTQYYGAAGNASTGVVVGGTQDNGTTKFTPGSLAHGTMFGGDGGYVAADQTNPNIFYGEYVYLQLFRSLDGQSADWIDGSYWNGFQYVCKPAPYLIPEVCNDSTTPVLFIAPFVLDPGNQHRLLAGAASLWVTNDANTPNTPTTGPSWASIKPPYFPPGWTTAAPISAVAVAPGNSSVCFVGYQNGSVFSTTNCTSPSPSWTEVDAGLPHRYVTRITVDRRNSNLAYVTLGGYTTPNVWTTTNGGASWTALPGSGAFVLPATPVYDIKVNPSHSTWLYVATEIGVFASEDSGATWQVPQGGPANVSVDELALFGSTMVAATHGRGLFQVRLPSEPVASDFSGDGRADLSVFRPDAGTWFVQNRPSTQWGTRGDIPVPGDYDGDGIADVAIYRPATGAWFISGRNAVTWGMPGDIPVPADYNGDGTTDIAVYRPSTGQWLVYGQAPVTFGSPGDIPVPGDYSGVGFAQFAVFHLGTWRVMGSTDIQWGMAGDLPVPADYDGSGLVQMAVFRPTTGTWYVRGLFAVNWGTAGDLPAPQDIDGDGRSELVVFRPASGTWFSFNPFTGISTSAAYGTVGDVPVAAPAWLRGPAVPGDSDGDRRTDVTVFRPSDGTWRSLLSSTGFAAADPVSWGTSGDVPVAGDFLGTRVNQPTVFRNGIWYILGGPTIAWGTSGDVPVAADYDGDGRTDVAVFRNGVWYILLSSSNFTKSAEYSWGAAGDVPVPGDYDGDGKADIAVFRNGLWFVLLSSANYDPARGGAIPFGSPNDVPVPGDYDGDGVVDLAVFRGGAWFVRQSSNGSVSAQVWGAPGDVAVPGNYNGDGHTDLAFFRPATGEWFVQTQSTIVFGNPSDTPVLKR